MNEPTPTPGHPELNVMRGVENSSGPLGQGHTYGIGAAIAAKFLAARTGNPTFNKETIYIYISDGGIQEEVSQGAGRVAGHMWMQRSVVTDFCMVTNTGEWSNVYIFSDFCSWGNVC